MSEYTIEWTENVGATEATQRVEAPTRKEAIKMYVKLTDAKVCTCGENDACDMCPDERVIA